MTDKHTLGDGPIQDEYPAEMHDLARFIDEIFNGPAPRPTSKTGFVLLVFPFGTTEGRANFISNGARRKDIVTLFKEMIARFEGQPELSGNA